MIDWDQRQNQQEQHLQLLQQPSVKIPTMTHFWSSKSISFQSLVLWFYHLFVVDQSAWPQSHSKPAVHCFSKTILFCVDKSCLWFWITEVIQWGCLLLPTLCASTRPPFSPNTEHNVQYSLRTQVIIDHLLQWGAGGGDGQHTALMESLNSVLSQHSCSRPIWNIMVHFSKRYRLRDTISLWRQCNYPTNDTRTAVKVLKQTTAKRKPDTDWLGEK